MQRGRGRLIYFLDKINNTLWQDNFLFTEEIKKDLPNYFTMLFLF